MKSFFWWGAMAATSAIFIACEQGDKGGVSIAKYNEEIEKSRVSFTEVDGEAQAKFWVSSLGKCIDLFTGVNLGVQEVSNTRIWGCEVNTDTQLWSFTEDNEIVAKNGLCLSTIRDNESDLIRAYAENCDGSLHQQWQYDEITFEVTNLAESDKCLGLWGEDGPTNDEEIFIWECEGKANQKWEWASLDYHFIRSAYDSQLYINTQPDNSEGGFGATPILSGWWSAEWVIEPTNGLVRIRNRWQPVNYLHVVNGVLKSGPVDPYGIYARWELIPLPEAGSYVHLIQNVLLPEVYVGLDGNGALMAGEMNTMLDGSALWEFIPRFY